ncbi:MAG: hypothetical protein RLY71_3961 [Pseudomonadota bacterium]|jgi:hypothetical protein
MTRPQRQRHVLWMAAFAAFLHAMLPTLHGLINQEGWQAVCSTGGQVTLVDTSDASADVSTGSPHSDSASLKALQCPLCLAGAHLFDLPAPQQLSFSRPELDYAPPDEQTAPVPGHRHDWAFSSRGPPFMN